MLPAHTNHELVYHLPAIKLHNVTTIKAQQIFHSLSGKSQEIHVMRSMRLEVV